MKSKDGSGASASGDRFAWPATADPGSRIRLSHHTIRLEDGHRVGVSVGGRGVPLVFLHGISLNRRVYLRLLSRLAGLGFTTIAIDAAAHGDTARLPRGSSSFRERVALTARSLDRLGVKSAVFVGHSMGGRMTIEFASQHPDRVLAAVLLDAAAGDEFDLAAPQSIRSPQLVLQGLADAAYDTHRDRQRLGAPEKRLYRRALMSAMTGQVLHPLLTIGSVRAVASSGLTAPLLQTMREHGVPTVVVHGEEDLIVPWKSAVSMAREADAPLYRIPGGYHSWMIANPRHGADVMRQLLNAELGAALRGAHATLGITGGADPADWEDATLEVDAWVRKLNRHPVVGSMETARRVQAPSEPPHGIAERIF